MTGSPAPTVSVIVPSYNSARYLAETIEAILAQTRPPDEVLVVDDGSTDGSADIAEGFAPDVRVLRVDHAGTAATRHRGFEATTGEFVANCDADDLWVPTKLEQQLAFLASRPELDAVGCLVDEFLSPDADESVTPGRGLRTRHRSPAASAILVRRSFLDQLGGYTSTEELGEFVDWFAQALSAGIGVGYVDDVLVRRRLHEHNSSRVFSQQSDQYLRVIGAHLDRKRAQDP